VITPRDLAHATERKKTFTRAGWIFEIKWDGFRALASHGAGDRVRLVSQRGHDLATLFPEIAAALGALPHLVLDGEIVLLDENGRADFDRLRSRQLHASPESIERASREHPALLFAFDLLELEGRDLRKLALLKRKKVLKKALEGSARIRYVDHVGEEGVKFFEAAEKAGVEGILAKRADAPYVRGRSPNWIKMKTRFHR
jgi:bifunctional non-homologous end joining protein LigD